MIVTWTVPSRLSAYAQQFPAMFPERVETYLKANGVNVVGVSLLNRIRLESGDDAQYVNGPFLRVESDVNPTALLDAIPTPDPPAPKTNLDGPMTTVNQYLDKVNAGGTPTQSDNVAATTALCRIVRALVNERVG
jgi:hypothetical protein